MHTLMLILGSIVVGLVLGTAINLVQIFYNKWLYHRYSPTELSSRYDARKKRQLRKAAKQQVRYSGYTGEKAQKMEQYLLDSYERTYNLKF